MKTRWRIKAGAPVCFIIVGLLVWGALLAAREISATLNDIKASRYSLDTSEDALSAAFLAAYQYGLGKESYGALGSSPARYQRRWALTESRNVREITEQSWFDAYRSGLSRFGRSGMVGFLKAFDSAAWRSDRLVRDPLFREFARSEGYNIDAPQDRRKALSLYFRRFGYDGRLSEPFTKLNRLLIANFVTPGEALNGRDSMGMDKLTHYYHARVVAEQYGVVVALLEGVGVEFTEFFMGNHHVPVLRAMFGDLDNLEFCWEKGWPRLYPTPSLYQERLSDFNVGNISYDEWKRQVAGMPFGWGDLAATFTGANSEKAGLIDSVLIGVWSLLVVVFVGHVRSRELKKES